MYNVNYIVIIFIMLERKAFNGGSVLWKIIIAKDFIEYETKP